MPSSVDSTDLDAVVVGAGFAGLYAVHRLRGLGLRVRAFDRAAGVGGTWYWNRYPGARCDVESFAYSYSFDPALEQEWSWTERYPAQPEILSYLEHVADRYDLRRDIQLETTVEAATFDETTNRWIVDTDAGRAVARFLILATGCLSDAQIPDIAGLETFTGAQYHTAHWPHERVDFTGKRVAVIGTGSSGIQAIPIIAAEAAHTYVLQRTPNFSIPANNTQLDSQTVREVKANYAEYRERIRCSPFYFPIEMGVQDTCDVDDNELRRVVESRWNDGGLNIIAAYADQLLSLESAQRVGAIVTEKIREKIADPAVAEKLVPSRYPFGAKRLCLDTGYYETFNRENVTLVDLHESPITGIVERGVALAGETVEVDAIVFATGFDAMTGSILRLAISGRDGLTIQEKWAGGPVTYLGIGIHGFPNLFVVAGPGSPSVLSNMVASIEQHVDWIADCLRHLSESGQDVIEATAEAERDWTAQVHDIGEMTLFAYGNSWYMGRNIGGKPDGLMPFAGGTIIYRMICDDVAKEGYSGFALGVPVAQPV